MMDIWAMGKREERVFSEKLEERIQSNTVLNVIQMDTILNVRYLFSTFEILVVNINGVASP